MCEAREIEQYADGTEEDVELAPDEVRVESLTNKYRCKDHGEWESPWCCACDDECPTCGKDYSPYDSDVEAVYVLKINKTRCPVCGDVHEF